MQVLVSGWKIFRSPGMVVLLGLGAFSGMLAAQNAPEKLTSCAVLKASFVEKDVAAAHPIDTERIQYALRACNPGQAVVLSMDGKKNSFLSAPLILPRGVQLYLAKGVTLYASSNPRDYDLALNSCGGPLKKEAVCKPFLFAYQAARSGVLGEGTIDGQGWSGGSQSAPDLLASYESEEFAVRGVTLRNAAAAHLGLYKTPSVHANSVQIEGGKGTGVLLSNTQNADLSGFSIHTGGAAVDLRASILGATSQVKIHNFRIAAGTGIHLGDSVYGSLKQIEIDGVQIAGSSAALNVDLTGTKGGTPKDVRISHLCLKQVAAPLTVQGAADLSSAPGITLDTVVAEGQGKLTAAGLQPESSATCPALSAHSAPQWQIEAASSLPGKKKSLLVAQDGSGDFRTVAEAVLALPATGGEIAVRPGTYREVVTIRKPRVHLYGTDADPAKTVIVFDHTSPKDAGTFNSATVFVEAPDVTIDHLTISNDSGNHGQAVALHVTDDRAIFHNLRVLGAQDTLFAAARYCYGDYGPCETTRQYFSDCYVEGNVDFVFGDSLAVFDRCELHGIAGGHIMYTAQSRHTAEQQAGHIFDHCHLTADEKAQTITLGRPWRPYATVVFLDTVIDAPVIPEGWTEWPRFGVPSFPTAVYAEFNSTGPGASNATREPNAKILTAAEAEAFRAPKFLEGTDGWKVPTEGLRE